MEIRGLISSLAYKYPIFTAADIADGALLMPGVTATDSSSKDLGALIVASSAAADAFGLMDGAFDYDTKGSTDIYQADTHVLVSVKPVFEATVIRVEYSQDDTAATTSAGSSTTFTATSLEDNIDGSWLYIVSGTAIGQLRVIITSGDGSCTVKTAFSPNTASADTFIKILRPFHQVAKLTTAATMLGTDVGAGSATVLILKNYIERLGGIEELNPTVHSGLSGLNTAGARFYADLIMRNTAPYTTE